MTAEALVYVYTDKLHYCDTPPLFADDGARWLATGTEWICHECGRRHVVAYIASVGTRWMTTDRSRDSPTADPPPTANG